MQYRNGDEVPAISLRGLGAALRRQAVWILVTTSLGVGLTTYVVLRQRPVYEARATLRMAGAAENATPPTDVLAALSGPSTVETEMEILRSRSVAEGVVDSLGLRVSIAEPRGVPRDTLFGTLHIASAAPVGDVRDPARLDGVLGDEPQRPDVRVALRHAARRGRAARSSRCRLPPGQRVPRRSRWPWCRPSAAAEAVRGGLRVTPAAGERRDRGARLPEHRPCARGGVVNGVAQSYIDQRGRRRR